MEGSMQSTDIKKISISHLILIIQNDKEEDWKRKYAEVELRKRIRNFGWNYDDLLHFDDKVIKERGLDIDNYVISPNVNIQQLMETYFMYNHDTNHSTNYLLFSEKHLCNKYDYDDIFFSKICNREIKNLKQRIANSKPEDISDLLLIKEVLEKRKAKMRENRLETGGLIGDIIYGEAMDHIDQEGCYLYSPLNNLSAEELYRYMRTKLGTYIYEHCKNVDEVFVFEDIINSLYGHRFIKKDSAKLRKQKRILLSQVRNNYEVNYQTENMQKAIKKIKRQ